MTQSQDKPGCLAAILRMLGIQSGGSGITTTDYPADAETDEITTAVFPYRIRDDFLSPAEHSFYLILKGMVGDLLTICPKVSLADVFFVPHPEENMSLYNRINRKHVDFLVCDPKTMKPRFAIELDDRSHERPDRVERDEFVNQVFQNAGLQLVRVPARTGYSEETMYALLDNVLGSTLEPGEPIQENVAGSPASQVPFCPKCGIQMVLRVARSGGQAGKMFYGCPNYPKCRSITPYVG